VNVIVGTTIQNALLIPAGDAGASRKAGAGTLPMPNDSLAATFEKLFANAESGLGAESKGIVGEDAVSEQDDGQEQPNPALFGFAAANCMLTGGRTEVSAQNAKAAETAALTVEKADSVIGAASLLVDAGLSVEAEHDPAQGLRATGALKFGITERSSEGNAEHNRTPNERFAAGFEGTQANAASSSVSRAPDTAKPDAVRHSFAFEPVIAENAKPEQPQIAFQIDWKAIQTELDIKTGFRINSAVGQTIAENLKKSNSLPNAGMTAGEQVQPKAETQPHAVFEPEGLTDAVNANCESDAKIVFSPDSGANTPKAESVQTEPEKFDEFGVQTGKVQDLNAAAQGSAFVHSSAAAEAANTQPKPTEGVVRQLEAPIKKEAAKGTDTSFKIKLKPEGLGEVTVDLRHVAGKLEVTIKTELSSTKALISENIQTLRNALSADDGPKALSLAFLTVEQDERQFGAFSQSGFAGERHSQPGSGNTFGLRAAAEQSKNSGTARYRTGLIDYTV